MVKCDSETWYFRKRRENLLDIFHRNCIWIVLKTNLTDNVSNSNLHERYDCVAFSRAIMNESLRSLGDILGRKGDRLPKIALCSHPTRA